jgi:hypothetical protein
MADRKRLPLEWSNNSFAEWSSMAMPVNPRQKGKRIERKSGDFAAYLCKEIFRKKKASPDLIAVRMKAIEWLAANGYGR